MALLSKNNWHPEKRIVIQIDIRLNRLHCATALLCGLCTDKRHAVYLSTKLIRRIFYAEY